NQPNLQPGDPPTADQRVGQVDSDATRATHSERPEVPRAQIPVSAEEGSQHGEAFQSSTRPEGGSTASSLVETSTTVREVAADPIRMPPQSNTPQPAKGNAPTQGVNFSGGLAEAVDAGAAEEVPASVSLTRRALRSLGRGHGGATVVQLRPAQFGKVTVRVQMEEGRVQADLVARTPEAARVLGEHLRLLRDSLEHKGLVVDRLEVREESKVESSRLDQHNEKDADEGRSGGERDRQEGETSSRRSSPQILGQLDDRADEFGQVLMAAEEQA
ncbi:MAG: flagellar hook-length control protein FliK, partial [Planctomycetota bacterium]|nr:flagellar hook-length control protein FliK [Planctomycetota bacterium]